jgi:protein BCP1
VEDDAEPAGAGGGKRKRDAAPETVYPRPEDQFFHKVSKMSFQWKSRELGDNDDVDSYQPTRLCMVIDADSVPQVRKQVKEMFTGDFEMRL